VQNSKRRNKERTRELALWESELRSTLERSRQQLGLARDTVIHDDVLVAEVIALAHPDAVQDRDAVIPAPRVDLAAHWFEARLLRRADTAAERLALAQEIAPLPDAEPAVRRRIGLTRKSVERAVEYFARGDHK